MADRTCDGTNADGDPCGAPPELVGPDGYCDAHRPGGDAEMRRRGQRGGYKSTAKNRAPGLDPDELPPLDSHEAAKKWSEIVGRAVAEGRLGRSEGNTVLRAVKVWNRSAVHEKTARVMDELEERSRAEHALARFRPLEGPQGREIASEDDDQGDESGAPDRTESGALPAAEDAEDAPAE